MIPTTTACNNVGLICPVECAEGYVDRLKKLGYEILALWTPSLDVTVQCASAHEIPFAANRAEEVLLRKDVEMIVVSAQPLIHAQIAVNALGIGKHVVCAAPTALNAGEASKMVEAAQYYPQLLALVGYGPRLLTVFQKMRECVAEGFLGSPLVCEVTVRCGPVFDSDRYDWRWEREAGGGVLNVVGSHVIDLLAFLLDRRALRAQGLVRSIRRLPTNEKNEDANRFAHRQLNADDFASFLLICERDASVTVTLNSTADGSAERESESESFHHEIFLSGPRGRLRTKNFELYRSDPRDTAGKGEFKCIFKESAEHLSFENTNDGGSGRKICINSIYGDSLMKICENLKKQQNLKFVDKQEVPPVTTADQSTTKISHLFEMAGFTDAQYVRAVIDAVRKSSCSGDWVKVDVPEYE